MNTATMTDKAAGLYEPTETTRVPVADIGRDIRVNTRPIDPAWVEARVGNFHPEALGTLEVSRRADGTVIVLDGQHRVALAKAVGYDRPLLCNIYEGLDLVQEAGLFVLLNDGRALRSGHKFQARITQGDPVACEILKTAELAGWKIGLDPSPGVIAAVAALERLWLSDRRHHPHDNPFVVANTLQTIVQAWQHMDHTNDASIIKGIGVVYVRDGLAVDLPWMVQQLAATTPKSLLLGAKGLQSGRGGALYNSVAELVVIEYNKGRRSRKLRDWR